MLVNFGKKRNFWRFSKKVDIFWWNRQCLWQKNIKSRRSVLLEACRLNNLHNYISILILTIPIRSLIHQQPVADSPICVDIVLITPGSGGLLVAMVTVGAEAEWRGEPEPSQETTVGWPTRGKQEPGQTQVWIDSRSATEPIFSGHIKLIL